MYFQSWCRFWSFVLIALCVFCGCRRNQSPIDPKSLLDPFPLFTLLPTAQTNIGFQNILTEGLNTNILMYEYFYNGGGVATADLNQDGLIDIYFTSNMGENKLYLNKGNMQFTDITITAGAGGRPGPWKTGVTFVDINGDYKLDIYICYSGALPDEKRINQLFINQGNDAQGIPRFSEKASQYGLASAAFSNQAYFFDCDRDQDLDLLLLNHNPKNLPILNEVSTNALQNQDDPLRGTRLYTQHQGFFEDVTRKSGLNGSPLSYGLGIGISDFNQDGWPDFYVSNDYAVPDYLYINNQNGTFSNKLKEGLGHNSQFSMGNDVADINNDGWIDLFTLDMLPEDNHRQKLLLAPDNYAKFDLNVRSGFYYQYMRNMLQLNNGNGTFSEIGQLAAISNTDWSWAALLADYDNDGWKDLYVTNGYHRDYTNLDFINYMDNYVKTKGRLLREDVLDIINEMPASNVVNYMFANQGGLIFKDQTKPWGLDHPSNSNGAAYADLDNDGDLDLIVNNINKPAFIYQNNAEKRPDNNFLQIKLEGVGLNTQGIGTKVTVVSDGKRQSLEQFNSRGYLSAVSPILHFGLETALQVDTLLVIWPDSKKQILTAIKSNQLITLKEKEAAVSVVQKSRIASPVFSKIIPPFDYQSPEIKVHDFDRQPLLINAFSYSGPGMIKGDLNNDGLEDIFIGGGYDTRAIIYEQQKNGRFIQKKIPAFDLDQGAVDITARIFDANGDGLSDLYVASGGYHNFSKVDSRLQDKLYINDGKGSFNKKTDGLPEMYSSKSCIAINDVNNDGHPDLFIGSRVVPGRYPEPPVSYLLINDGTGKFTDQINSIAPQLQNLGMITDAVWVDLNGDDHNDLIVVGEWLPVTIFINENNKLVNQTRNYFDKEYIGWWNKIEVGDFNGDLRPDLIIGNTGVNTQFRGTDAHPAEIYFKDFDNNGSMDPIFCFFIQGVSYPYVTRDEFVRQISGFRSRFTTYKSFADVTIRAIFKPEELAGANHLSANYFETAYFILQANGKFDRMELPIQTQFAPVHTITILDFNYDGIKDVLLCGNNSHVKLRLGKMDANYGTLLMGKSNGTFEYINQSASGLNLRGDVRSVMEINKTYLFGINQGPVLSYRLSK